MTKLQAEALYKCAKEHSIINDRVVVIFDDVDFVDLIETPTGILVATHHTEIPLTQYEISEFKIITNKLPCERMLKIKNADNMLFS